ncbi:MAG TPA: SurA N-terminal domain-containing protein [Acidobacteriaceae bacterium]|jgi:peptidyl-prolyl cis-trans isomerase SurA|nr:SurA N-terminal domain-containing protein [Acidobacteriaceae bacterium]
MPMYVRTFSIFLASSLVLIAGCHKGPQQGVVATVNGHPIFQTDVDKAYTAQLASNPQQQAPTPDQADSLRLNIIHAQILEAILDQRAAKQGLTATDAEVEAKLAEMKAPYTEEQFQTKLKAANLTLDQLKHEIRRNLTQEKLLNKEINSRITVTDADVRNYYNAHKADFNLIEPTYHLAQIVVTDQGNAQAGNLQNNKANSDEDARKKIQVIKGRIDSGEDFGELAANFSENTQTNQNGGEMGFLPESQLKANPAIYAAISKLNAGQTTDIIPQVDPTTHKPVAYAIFKLISKDAAGQREYDDPRVQQSIRQQLHESRAQLLQTAYREMLSDQAKVENFFAEQVFKRGAQ